MSPNRIIVARFSPTGRTRRLMSMIAQGLAGTALPVEELDLTDRWEREEARTFGKGDLVFLGVPVYFGRVPLPMQSLAKWTGNGAAAVPVAAYGCRAHEDTLRELAAVLRAAGFVVPAGAAFPIEPFAISEPLRLPAGSWWSRRDRSSGVATRLRERGPTRAQ